MTASKQPSRTLEVILTLPSSIPFARDALGQQYETRLAGHSATLVLPSFRWRKQMDSYVSVPPVINAVRRDVNWDDHLNSTDAGVALSAWGKVSMWQTKPRPRILVAHVNHILAVVPLPKRASRVRVSEVGGELWASSYAWWLTLRDWIETTTPHLLEALESSQNKSLVSNTRAWSWDGTKGRNVPITERIAVYGGPSVGVPKKNFEAIAKLAGNGTPASTMHLFVRNARVALFQSNYRTAVLEASTAAELALRQLLDARLAGVDSAVAEFMSKNTREMGRIVDLLNDLDVPLPLDMRTRLLHVRNRAIHQGKDPSAEQAKEVVNLVGEVVEQVAPRHQLLLSAK